MNLHRLFAWLPPDQRQPLLQRMLIVWAIALLIALGNWAANQETHQNFDKTLVYAYAISTFIWLFTDVVRYPFKRLLRAQGPYCWPPALQASLMLLVGIPLGYVLGTAVGDAYAGWSTWDLWDHNPGRFKGMLASSVAISIGFVAYFYQRGKAEALASQVTQSQLMLLQSQLEPHMLFNTLAHLRALIGQDPARALTMLDHLDDYLRTTLQASRQTMHQPLHPLAEEFSRLRDYLSLMAIRMGPRMAFALDLPPALAAVPVPSFILQPLVENAIRHGLEPRVEGGRIDVQARTEGAQLVLTVRDNGCGISELALTEWAQPVPLPVPVPVPVPLLLSASAGPAANSWGLGHVRQRLHTLYGPRAQMHISRIENNNDNDSTDSGGTCVVLTLPLTPPV